MTIEAERLPPFSTVLGVMDQVARAASTDAKNHTVAAVKRTMPARSGRARAGQRGSIRRTRNGYLITISPSSKPVYPNGVSAAEVTRWVGGGTGVFGPTGRPIRPRRGKAFHLPGGVWSSKAIQGQRPQHIYERVQTSEEAAVSRILKQGAAIAAREAERVIGGRR